MWRLEENDGPADAPQPVEPLCFCLLTELVESPETRTSRSASLTRPEPRAPRLGPGIGSTRMPAAIAARISSAARVGNGRRSGVRHQRDAVAALRGARSATADFAASLCSCRLVVGVVMAWRASRWAVRRVSSAAMSGDLAQDAQRPHRDVFEVADRRGDHEQRAGHVRGGVYCTIGGSVLVDPARPVQPGLMRRNDDCFRTPSAFRRRSARLPPRDASDARDARWRAHARRPARGRQPARRSTAKRTRSPATCGGSTKSTATR